LVCGVVPFTDKPTGLYMGDVDKSISRMHAKFTVGEDKGGVAFRPTNICPFHQLSVFKNILRKLMLPPLVDPTPSSVAERFCKG
jgi:hypothetical protein